MIGGSRRTPARLILVRHGESTWNAEGRLQGQADPPLSSRGRAQAEALRAWVAAQGVDAASSSDLTRARETAELLGHADARLDPRWREVDIGEWAGRPSAEVRADDGDAFAAWRAGERPPPGGEDHGALARRVAEAARELLAAGGSQLVVCHGGPIRAACTELLGLTLTQLGGVGNGSATVLERADGHVRLAAYNVSGAGGEDLG